MKSHVELSLVSFDVLILGVITTPALKRAVPPHRQERSKCLYFDFCLTYVNKIVSIRMIFKLT